jgi:uncharacterized protein (DUF1800 family)
MKSVSRYAGLYNGHWAMDQIVARLSCAKGLASKLMKALVIDEPTQEQSRLGVR